MNYLAQRIRNKGWLQSQVAEWWSMSQPQLSRELNGTNQLIVDAIYGLPDISVYLEWKESKGRINDE